MGVATKVEQIQHRTPLCERSHTPIEIIPMEEYYLKQLEFRPKLKKTGEGIEFHPQMHRQILLDWMDSLTTDYPMSQEEVLRHRDTGLVLQQVRHPPPSETRKVLQAVARGGALQEVQEVREHEVRRRDEDVRHVDGLEPLAALHHEVPEEQEVPQPDLSRPRSGSRGRT